jgi:hypothetical protein
MVQFDAPVLTTQQLADYEELGFLHSIPILSADEICHYLAEAEKTCEAIGGRVTRLDGLHMFFRWAWELSTHPRLLNCLEQLLGPDILLKSTRLFCKHGRALPTSDGTRMASPSEWKMVALQRSGLD